ncbi:hypothetical protein KEM56_001243, partial [Ascosphaera pollenicola]
AQIALNEAVVSVTTETREGGRKVVTTTPLGKRYEFDDVVTTLPLGYLKTNRSIFSPPLPGIIQKAIDSLGYGALEKVYVRFPSAFWHIKKNDIKEDERNQHHPVNMVDYLNPSYASMPKKGEFWNQECVSLSVLPTSCAQPTLLFYLYGPTAEYITSSVASFDPESSEYFNVIDTFLKPFYTRLPRYDSDDPACQPCAVLATQWSNDQFTGHGSYTNFQVNLEDGTEHVDTFSDNNLGMTRGIWFAGIFHLDAKSLISSHALSKSKTLPFRGLTTATLEGRSVPINQPAESIMDVVMEHAPADSPLSEVDVEVKTPIEIKEELKEELLDPSEEACSDMEAGEEAPASTEEVKEALFRPPPVNSSYLPLPWKGRLGYACLNTYLRTANPPVFSSRTCRIASILEHRHPLADLSQPEHAIKNRPDLTQPADLQRGMMWVHELGLANARDIVKMLRWNDKYGIKFMRLSSEMFPFASHEEYGYSLESFAADVLAEAGRVAAELGHRLTSHPGQYTQLGSPREQVAINAIRDLEYHAELLRLLKLPEQQNRDAVIILHMGGVFGNKKETLDRFRTHYATLSQDIKNRLVLENDDVSWTVHDLLPICEELNIPMVLDYHHHNINFDSNELREGTLDILQLYDRITAIWKKKGITQKMHYSEPTPSAITRRERRKHSGRVQMLPPCPPTMDLMIEAKDKEQAVFDLMRTYKLPGFEKINDIIPYTRQDENKPPPKRRSKKAAAEAELEPPPPVVPDDEVAMGGPDNRVHWPPGMEHYLKPPKRVVAAKKTPKKRASKVEIEEEVIKTEEVTTPTRPTRRKRASANAELDEGAEGGEATPTKRATTRRRTKKKPVREDTESLTDESTMPSLSEDEYTPAKKRTRKTKKT